MGILTFITKLKTWKFALNFTGFQSIPMNNPQIHNIEFCSEMLIEQTNSTF